MLRTAVWMFVLAGCGRVGFDVTTSPDAVDDSGTVTIDAACEMTAGLIGAWSMDATDVSGATVRDRSGNGRHGMVIGTPLPVTRAGRIGDALDFSATTDTAVTLPSLPLVTTAGAFTTVALWFFHADANVDEGILVLPSTAVAMPPRYGLWLTTDQAPLSLCINGGTGECWGLTDPGLLGRWVHVTAVFVNGRTDGGSLYIDGAPVPMTCRFGNCTQTRTVRNPVLLGGPDPGYAWHGQLDEVRIYDRKLTATEIAELYACQTR